ncbi:uncharacterized protein TRUGW13939_01014 [Talaromyces rugulosus]|uniref:Mucin n=1 Tax=Talaromyces rugulosus TaxID=121627 RepID=A0A7H8QJ01_TALRU|nr:uncharacterized protein TRUGW13939_01014 [Talaromyces rugulosus]QKX53934.1 hypothetical protein TRUGW13939_01014 [Talaromyces rugulosus]
MHVLADPFDDDFESLPLAVRRKFFSNLERFRLERTRLAQGHQHKHNHQLPYAKRPLRGHHARARTVAISSPFSSSRPRSQQLRKGSPRRNHNGLFLDHESWQCFHSLPPKIQQSHFSKEEQRLLQQATPATDIVDAADRAVLKFERARRRAASAAALNDTSARRIANRRRSATSSIIVPSSMSSSSTDLPDSAIEMDESILNSFRWLDEDDLDLSLDNYHRHVAETALPSRRTSPSSTPNRMPSFRRTMSFTRNRNPTSGAGHRTVTSQSATTPFSDQPNRPIPSRHISHRSTSSIDPAAQYYQDPEARLKLRVYLASPQKFDEAIEFGFPSLEDKENNSTPTQTSNDSNKRVSQISQSTQSGWTFFDDETTSFDLDFFSGALGHNREATTHLRKVSTEVRRPQPLQPLQSGNATGRRREMTLKMTLTRPDLRTADQTDIDDPLRLADLPPADETVNVWDDLPEPQGVVKKMWRRIRGR